MATYHDAAYSPRSLVVRRVEPCGIRSTAAVPRAAAASGPFRTTGPFRTGDLLGDAVRRAVLTRDALFRDAARLNACSVRLSGADTAAALRDLRRGRSADQWLAGAVARPCAAPARTDGIASEWFVRGAELVGDTLTLRAEVTGAGGAHYEAYEFRVDRTRGAARVTFLAGVHLFDFVHI
jgi:hypothetical protein